MKSSPFSYLLVSSSLDSTLDQWDLLDCNSRIERSIEGEVGSKRPDRTRGGFIYIKLPEKLIVQNDPKKLPQFVVTCGSCDVSP